METEHRFTHKHIISLDDLSDQDIDYILRVADSFKEISERPIKKVPTLRGKTVVNLFLRTQHPYPPFLRGCRQASERRYLQYRTLQQQYYQG